MVRTKIKAVALDYGNVLSQPQDPALVNSLLTLARLKSEDFDHRYARHRLAYDRGELSGADYWAEVTGDAKIRDESGRLAALIDADVASWLDLNDTMVAWVGVLSGCNIATSILSNLPRDVLNGLRRNHRGMLKQFAVTIFSCEVGCVKPDTQIFDLLLEALRVEASGVLFVDDRQENVAAAVRLGMHGVRYDSLERFCQRLEAEYDLPLPRRIGNSEVQTS